MDQNKINLGGRLSARQMALARACPGLMRGTLRARANTDPNQPVIIATVPVPRQPATRLLIDGYARPVAVH